jgi:hypothetical protein
MFVYKSRFLTRGEVWYDEEPDGTRVDWLYHRQRSFPLAKYRCKEFHTVLIGLRKTPTELFAALDEKTAHRISEAQEKDRLRCERCDAKDTQLMDVVEGMWNQFAGAQNTPLLDRLWIDQIRKAGVLDLVAAKDPEGNVLAYHLVLLTPKRARQLIAISPYKAVPSVSWRNAVSRANCLIHWHNFLTFRERGINDFDFGGWYPGTSDIRLLGINRFKMSLGGCVVKEYDCEQPLTVKGWGILTTVKLLARLRGAGRPARPNSERKNDATQSAEPQISPAFR